MRAHDTRAVGLVSIFENIRRKILKDIFDILSHDDYSRIRRCEDDEEYEGELDDTIDDTLEIDVGSLVELDLQEVLRDED